MAIAREAEPVHSLKEVREAGLDREDLLGVYHSTPLHRDMGVHVVRGVEPWRIFAQYMGRSDGPTKGKDGNVHMADSKLGLIAMVSHLPAMLPVAVGCALAFRIREEKRVAVGWFGEGASARGDAHEAMNLAGVRRLPAGFICRNHQWA